MQDDHTIDPTELYEFYSSKPRLIHMAANIWLSPVLLYLLGAWVWPPTLPHYVAFFITGLIAMRYLKPRWSKPRLVFDDEGFYCGEYYPKETILKVEPVMRALKLSLLRDGEPKDKIVSLGWARKSDLRIIVAMAMDRFNPRE